MTIITGLPCESLARTRKDEGMIVMLVNPALAEVVAQPLADVGWRLGVRRGVLVARRSGSGGRRRGRRRTGEAASQEKRT